MISRTRARGRAALELDELANDSVVETLPNAERRHRDANRDGLCTLEAEVEFDVLQHFDDADELIEVNADVLESWSSLRKRIREAPPPYVLRERYRSASPRLLTSSSNAAIPRHYGFRLCGVRQP